MSELKDYEDDPLYREALDNLYWALDDGYASQQMKAIDNLISVRLAIMMEEMAARLEQSQAHYQERER